MGFHPPQAQSCPVLTWGPDWSFSDKVEWGAGRASADSGSRNAVSPPVNLAWPCAEPALSSEVRPLVGWLLSVSLPPPQQDFPVPGPVHEAVRGLLGRRQHCQAPGNTAWLLAWLPEG